ncbi:MAG TPA: biotin transporter BioY [Nitrososphaerales archaeon]|nr:biotin transporter BioY [Nitrososphaerales archaeon]
MTGRYPRTKGISLAALFAALLSISSIVSIPIPFSPVPVTLQVLVVFLILALLGPLYGSLSCLVYLALGVMGLPVFAGASAGPGVLVGPLGGYLVSFPVAVFVGGFISRTRLGTKKADSLRVSLAVLTSLATIYAIGVLWLALFLGIGIVSALIVGAIPFIPIDTLKAIMAIPIALRFRWSRMYLPVHSPVASVLRDSDSITGPSADERDSGTETRRTRFLFRHKRLERSFERLHALIISFA